MTDAASARSKPSRRDRLIREFRHDTYRSHGKLPDPTVCPRCTAVYRADVWRWEPPPAGANERTCPACLRIEDGYPAGTVRLRGRFLDEHWDEIVGLIRNEESKKKAEHALERIMDIDRTASETVVTTTDIHLARRIGDAIHAAYAGELGYAYEEGEKRLRVSWRRDR